MLTNDIGLVIIDEAILFDNRVKPIAMNERNIEEGITATLNGWGSIEVCILSKFLWIK